MTTNGVDSLDDLAVKVDAPHHARREFRRPWVVVAVADSHLDVLAVDAVEHVSKARIRRRGRRETRRTTTSGRPRRQWPGGRRVWYRSRRVARCS